MNYSTRAALAAAGFIFAFLGVSAHAQAPGDAAKIAQMEHDHRVKVSSRHRYNPLSAIVILFPSDPHSLRCELRWLPWADYADHLPVVMRICR